MPRSGPAAARAPRRGVPLWQRMVDLKMPLLLIFGRNDRARAGERAELLRETYPQLGLHNHRGLQASGALGRRRIVFTGWRYRF